MDNTTNSYGHEASSSKDVILLFFRVLVCVIGLFGNMIVIFVILLLKEYKKSIAFWYVLQLAFADSIFLLNIPFKIVEANHGAWIFSSTLCKTKETVLFLNYYSSILFLMVMSIDRYILVCHRFSDNFLLRFRTRRNAYIITIIVWVTSLLMCVPIMLYSDKRGIEPRCQCQYAFPKSAEEFCTLEGMWSDMKLREECRHRYLHRNEEPSCIKVDWPDYDEHDYYYGGDYYEHGITAENPVKEEKEVTYEMGCSYVANGKSWTSYLLFNFIVMFVLPFMVMLFCYSMIAVQLRRPNNLRPNQESSTSAHIVNVETSGNGGNQEQYHSYNLHSKSERNRIRVTFTCCILVVLFLICWLPFHAVHLSKILGISGKSSEFCAWIGRISSLLGYINSALNPYVYNFIGTKFGKRLRSAAGIITKSVKKQTSCSHQGGATPNEQRNTGNQQHSSSESLTGTTKIHKENIEMTNLHQTLEEKEYIEGSVQQPLVSST